MECWGIRYNSELSQTKARELDEGIMPTHASHWPKSDPGEHKLLGTSSSLLLQAKWLQQPESVPPTPQRDRSFLLKTL